MTTWNLSQARRDFLLGRLSGYSLDLFLGAWTISLYCDGKIYGPLIDHRSGKARRFKSLDSAVSTLEAIGFKVDHLFPTRIALGAMASRVIAGGER